MAGLSDGVNAATETLECDGAFEVLRLTPGVYQPLEIKRRYRRLALVLHPDKNRHPDAEAAFKKLTAAFEELHDPTRQAMCRAETEQKQRNRPGPRPLPRRRSSSTRVGGSSREDGHEYGSARSAGNGSAEAPRWCREGEYVPEAERKREDTPDTENRKARAVHEFMADFEREERAFKEQVAQAKERNAEKKRLRAEARSAQEEERMRSLREDVLGSSEDGSGVEAKTASWQKFYSTTKPKRRARGAGAGPREKPQRSNSTAVSSQGGVDSQGGNCADRGSRDGVRSQGGEGDSGARGASGESVGPDGSQVGRKKAAGPAFVCWVCRRGFKSAIGLAHHEAKSELHDINVQLREFLSP